MKDTAHLNRTVAKGHTEKQTSENAQLEGGKHVDIWEKCPKQKRQEGQGKAEGSARTSVWLEQNEQGKSSRKGGQELR